MYSDKQREQLLKLAHDSIRHGLDSGHPLSVNTSEYEESLNEKRACFVTLHLDGELRGCIGSLEAHRKLVDDIAHNAFSAAFQDPRFPPLTEPEFEKVDIDISILTPPVAMQFSSEPELLDQIRPGVDGLIIEDQGRRGTFLPSVWEQLPDKIQFLMHLKMKAGLSPQHWSDSLTVSRYETESFG
ncbi:MAG: AmmeMemoRadiSam system protein A [Gammaproteobacteria bacterium]|nr:AmmeMemoRadiSam system protein A [Gammaproteobacteria bacterium]